MDMRTGEIKNISLYDATASRGNQITLLNNYRWDNGLEWDLRFKYDHALGSICTKLRCRSLKLKRPDGYFTQMPMHPQTLRRTHSEPYVVL
mgnify:CR=1 FL=1